MFNYRHNVLFAEEVPLPEIAEKFGTPCYVYSKAAIEKQWHAFNDVFAGHPHHICYAVKANSNLAVLEILAKLGSGFDIVSGGELARVIAAGGNPRNIIFSGVGKAAWEIEYALKENIYCFNVESESEVLRINKIAKQMIKRAPIALRINPNVDAGTHPYISTGLLENKFGIALDETLSLVDTIKNLSHINLIGIGCHIGSQLIEIEPFISALEHLLELTDALQKKNIPISHIDIGGGLGVKYLDENPPNLNFYASAILNKLQNKKINLILEPGRAIVALAGILLTRIEYLKHTPTKNFAIVDCAMNDFLRPSLYNAYQNIIPAIQQNNIDEQNYDIVGPVCETGDFLGKNRNLKIKENDLLAICAAGAYGFSMSSNYNSRPRAAEVMVDRNQCYLVREREKIEELFEKELNEKS
jgi:diaminopimelate decarboxylase